MAWFLTHLQKQWCVEQDLYHEQTCDSTRPAPAQLGMLCCHATHRVGVSASTRSSWCGVAAFSCFYLLSARSAGTCISLDTGFHCSQKANLEFAVGVEADWHAHGMHERGFPEPHSSHTMLGLMNLPLSRCSAGELCLIVVLVCRQILSWRTNSRVGPPWRHVSATVRWLNE